MSRRVFVGSTSLAALAAAGVAARPQGARAEAAPSAEQPVQILECDVVVVGAGISGLAAAVQASELGADVVVLEKGSSIGGNGAGTEGILGVGSSMQREQGIEVDPVEVVRTELVESQWLSSGAYWYDLISKSAENIDWLMQNGVEFSGAIENEQDNVGSGLFNTLHWWKEESGAVGYVPGMLASAQANGARFLTETPATGLVVEDGAVRGVYAQSAEGDCIRVDAKAVILASGGVGANPELLLECGMPQSAIDEMVAFCVPTVEGDGYRMAIEAGAKGRLANASIQAFQAISGFPMDVVPPYCALSSGSALISTGNGLWVDQDAYRFCDESISSTYNVATPAITCMRNKASYCIFDKASLDLFVASEEDQEFLDEGLAATLGSTIFEADTIEGLAEQVGLDAERLSETFATYDGYCDAGADLMFGKPAEYLTKLQAPYYIAKICNMHIVVDGGITTNIRCEALDRNMDPIPGLYAVGLDGAMLWQQVYTQNMPGSCVANQVNSGRNAAKNVVAKMAEL